jgi:hypothetical protein
MAEIASFEKYLWPITMLLATGLAALVVRRKNYKAYPLFFAYILATLAQNLAFALTYQLWGFGSPASFTVAWATQSLVVTLRALAVAEIFRHILAKYAGIWALGWRVFLAVAALVLAYAWTVGEHRWKLVAVNADRSLELAIAVAILGVFVFARYYQVVIERTPRFLAIGFFLYSCFRVLNDTVLERWLTSYTTLWNFLETLAFLATLLFWTWAFRLTQQRPPSGAGLLPGNLYSSLSPEINARLKALNEQLGHFWYPEGKKT